MFLVDAVDTFDPKYNFWLFSNIFDGFSLLFPCGFLSIKNALIRSIFGLEKCSLQYCREYVPEKIFLKKDTKKLPLQIIEAEFGGIIKSWQDLVPKVVGCYASISGIELSEIICL